MGGVGWRRVVWFSFQFSGLVANVIASVLIEKANEEKVVLEGADFDGER